MKAAFTSCKTDFLTGLAVVLPAVVSIWIVVWLFGAAAQITDTLLVLLPKAWTHAGNGDGPMHVYWSGAALALAILMVVLVGRLARHYIGKKIIQLLDLVLMRVPLLNRIYSTLKQINGAFLSSKAASFRQVVLVQFPHPGLYSLGFLTGTQNGEVQSKTGKTFLSVFVPTPPLTSGAIVLVPEADVIRLNMSVAEGLKFIMSLGSVSPDPPAHGDVRSASADRSDAVPALLESAPTLSPEGEGLTQPIHKRPGVFKDNPFLTNSRHQLSQAAHAFDK